MKKIGLLSMIAVIALFSFKIIDNTGSVRDYFSVPGPINFNKNSYKLSWSDHPNNRYFKQEYLPSTEKSETFNKMIMMEVVIGDISIADAVKGKISELEERKKSDPVTNYSIIENKQTGEYLLDFVVGQSTDKSSIVEWNAYRYVKLKEKSGKKGIMLFAYCKRSYGAATTGFLKSLKTERLADINSFATYVIPTVQIGE